MDLAGLGLRLPDLTALAFGADALRFAFAPAAFFLAAGLRAALFFAAAFVSLPAGAAFLLFDLVFFAMD